MRKYLYDLTILIDKDIPFYRVRQILLEAQIAYVKNIYPIDVYYDKALGEKMALSIRIVLQSDEGTLQEMQLVQAVESVLSVLVREFDAVLRT